MQGSMYENAEQAPSVSRTCKWQTAYFFHQKKAKSNHKVESSFHSYFIKTYDYICNWLMLFIIKNLLFLRLHVYGNSRLMDAQNCTCFLRPTDSAHLKELQNQR